MLTTAPADWRALDGQHVRIAAPLTLAGTDGLPAGPVTARPLTSDLLSSRVRALLTP